LLHSTSSSSSPASASAFHFRLYLPFLKKIAPLSCINWLDLLPPLLQQGAIQALGFSNHSHTWDRLFRSGAPRAAQGIQRLLCDEGAKQGPGGPPKTG